MQGSSDARESVRSCSSRRHYINRAQWLVRGDRGVDLAGHWQFDNVGAADFAIAAQHRIGLKLDAERRCRECQHAVLMRLLARVGESVAAVGSCDKRRVAAFCMALTVTGRISLWHGCSRTRSGGDWRWADVVVRAFAAVYCQPLNRLADAVVTVGGDGVCERDVRVNGPCIWISYRHGGGLAHASRVLAVVIRRIERSNVSQRVLCWARLTGGA
ncbi:hypothetical protein AWB64_04799 [Caballeronia sordidicola]|uniref:Uncharacterized protein n=1 Tax=Caballeronia sordidicola TaxID=196367 RepID=A0A158HMZ3_CABSO|nr:hypothetical protein AWB64_04799 [Caballeronia sordidicola]